MSELGGDLDDVPEPPELAPLVDQRSFAEHPLFPLDDGEKETRDIRYISFRRRRSDGRVDHCPEDLPAADVKSWADVVGPWGGGEYKAIGKDAHHRIVAWYPAEHGGWLLFDQPSKPFTLRDGRRYERERPIPMEQAAPPPPPPPPAAPAAPTAPSLGIEALLVAMVNQSAETSRAILTAVLGQHGQREPSAIEMMRAMREWMPSGTSAAALPTSIPEQLTTLKTLLELTRPSAPTPEPSILGELGGLMTTVIQTDAAARASARPAEPAERRAPPSRVPRLVHVPGIGLVDVVQPEPPQPPSRLPPPSPATAAQACTGQSSVAQAEPVIDLETLKENPVAVATLRRSLEASAGRPPSPAPLVPRPPDAPPPSERDHRAQQPADDACNIHPPIARSANGDAIDRTGVVIVDAVPGVTLGSNADSSPSSDAAPASAAPPTAYADAVHDPVPTAADAAPMPTLSAEAISRALAGLPGFAADAETIADGLLRLPPEAMSFLLRFFPPNQAQTPPGGLVEDA